MAGMEARLVITGEDKTDAAFASIASKTARFGAQAAPSRQPSPSAFTSQSLGPGFVTPGATFGRAVPEFGQTGAGRFGFGGAQGATSGQIVAAVKPDQIIARAEPVTVTGEASITGSFQPAQVTVSVALVRSSVRLPTGRPAPIISTMSMQRLTASAAQTATA